MIFTLYCNVKQGVLNHRWNLSKKNQYTFSCQNCAISGKFAASIMKPSAVSQPFEKVHGIECKSKKSYSMIGKLMLIRTKMQYTNARIVPLKVILPWR